MPGALGMRPYSTLAWVYLESLGLNSSSLPSLRAEKKGVCVCVCVCVCYFWALRAWCGSFISQARACLPIHRVPSSAKEAALLPLGSYSSYRLLGKVY